MDRIRIIPEMSRKKPELRPLAEELMREILAEMDEDGTFANPELETEFQEWMAAREARKGA